MGISILSLISACTALVASVVSPFVTISTARRQINASVISANRTRWLESLREQIACLLSELTTARILLVEDLSTDMPVRRDRKALIDRIENLSLTIARIRLMLNTTEQDHVEFAAMITRAMHHLRYNENPADLQKSVEDLTEQITQAAQVILKREWVRVKTET